MKKMSFWAAIILLIFSVPMLAQAAVITKAATGTDLTAGASWTGAVAPTTSDTATWSGGTSLGPALTITGSSPTWGAIDVESATGTVGISGTGTLTLSGNQTINAIANSGVYDTGNDLTISNAIALGASQTWTIDTSRTMTASGIVSGTAFGVTKGGAGTLILSGINTYTGQTTLSAGTLRATTSAQALGTGALSLGGGILELANDTGLSFNNNTTITGNTTIKSERLTNGAGVTQTLGTLSMGAQTLTVDKDATVTSGTAGLTFGAVTLSATGGTFTINTGTLLTLGAISGNTFGFTVNGAGDTNITGIIGTTTGTVTKSGTGTLTLSGANTYTGATAIQAGTASVSSINSVSGGSASSSLGVPGSVANGTIALGSTTTTGTLLYTGTGETTDRVLNLAGTTGGGAVDQSGTGALKFTSALTATGAGSKTLTLQGSTAGTGEIAGAIVDNGGANTTSVTKAGTGTWTFSGANTYSGATAVNAGTLQVSNANAVGTGALTVADAANLDVGTTNLSVTGVYTQSSGSTLKLNANSSSTFGKITSASNASVNSGSAVSVTVGGYIPNNATLKIIDGSGGSSVSAPATITSSNSFITFSGASSSGDLILTASRTASGFSSVATNSNGAAVGNVLDNVTNPSSDMTTVLNTLSGLSGSQVASAENTLSPTADGAVLQTSTQAMNQFINNVVTHLENVRTLGGATGVSTGDVDDYLKGVDIWAQGLGDYAHQGSRGASNGYNATTWGVSGGADILLGNDSLRMGIGSGYGQTFVRSKDNSGKTDINSIPAILYVSYEGTNYPLYLDGAFTFNYNSYKGSRQLAVGGIARTASADYNGQQYSGYFEGGYSLFYKKFRITPLASFQYMHLHVGSYTETGADSLNLYVAPQDYDMAQTGLGIKCAYPFENKYVSIVPDVHFKWLYDWIGEKQATTASFVGGGTSFATNSFNPARSGYDIGTKLLLKTKYNVTLGVDYDFLIKQDYYEHTGIVDVKYSF